MRGKDMKKEKTIVVDVTKRPQATFRVGAGTHVTLVILGLRPKVHSAQYTVRLVGAGAKASIVGIVVAAGTEQFSLHTHQYHAAPSGMSDLLVKSVLSGRAKFLYDGEIRVEKLGQKTDAYQRNENLLLSQTSSARSDPSLEILANDVRCTHGATVGKIGNEELWYLESRGIAASLGRHMVTVGFLEAGLAKISDTIVSQKLRQTVWKTLSKLPM